MVARYPQLAFRVRGVRKGRIPNPGRFSTFEPQPDSSASGAALIPTPWEALAGGIIGGVEKGSFNPFCSGSANRELDAK